MNDGTMGGGTNTQVVDPVRANRQSIDPLHPLLRTTFGVYGAMFLPARAHPNLAVSRLPGLASTDEQHECCDDLIVCVSREEP